MQNLKLCQKAADFFKSPIIILHLGDQETEDASLGNFYFLLSRINDKRFVLENTPSVIRQRLYSRLGVYLEDFLEFKKDDLKHVLILDMLSLGQQLKKKNTMLI